MKKIILLWLFLAYCLVASSSNYQSNYQIEPYIKNLDGSIYNANQNNPANPQIIARFTENNYTFDITSQGWKVTLLNSFRQDGEKLLEFETVNIQFPDTKFIHEYSGSEVSTVFYNGLKKEKITNSELRLSHIKSESATADNFSIDMRLKNNYPYYEINTPVKNFDKINFSIDKPAFINENGELVITAELGEIILEKPEGVILFDSLGRKKIKINYQLDGNRVSFTSPDDLSGGFQMIIDPVIRIESSYYGGLDDDRFYDSDRDPEGNYYLAGVTSSSGNVAFNGHQTIKNNLEDAFLVKINPAGDRLWASYYGGDGVDVAYGVSVNAGGQVSIAGETFSVEDIASPGSHQEDFGGGLTDGFIATFDKDGNRLWGTYYGGEISDKLNDVFVDSFGNTYVCGFTDSENNIFASGYQSTLNGNFDGIIAKFNPLGARRWATYYGGADEDYLQSIELDPDGNIYFGGSTKSTTSIAKDGFQNSNNGGFDTFFGKMDNNGNLDWCSYYGKLRDDLGNRISLSGEKILLAGSSQSSDMAIGGNQLNLAGSFDGFYALFDSPTSLNHSSYLGGFQIDEIRGAFLSENAIYVAGTSRSNNNISFNPFQEFRGGKNDGMFAKYDLDGNIAYSSYYGGDEVDVFRAVRVDSDTLFLAGFTASIDSISQNGYQNSLVGSDDGFFVFFEDPVTQQDKIEVSLSEAYCAGNSYSLDFNLNGDFPNPTNVSLLLSDKLGDFEQGIVLADGSFDPAIENTIDFDLSSTMTYGSLYKMKLVSENPDIESNTINDNVEIIPLLSLANKLDAYCEDRKFDLNAETHPGMTYDWTFPDGTVLENVNKIQVFHQDAGEYDYKVTQKGKGCEETLDFSITVKALPEISIIGPELLCQGEEVTYEVTSLEDNSGKPIQWTINDMTIISGELNLDRKIRVRVNGDNPTISVQIFGFEGICHPIESLDINYFDEENIEISGPEQTCKSCTETYTANAELGSFDWQVTGGEIIGNPDSKSIDVKWADQTLGNIKLFYESQNGCTSANELDIVLSDNIEINISPEPAFVCQGESVQFLTSSATFLTNLWEVENGQILIEGTNSVATYWPDGQIGKVTLTQINQNTSTTETKTIQFDVREKVGITPIEEYISTCLDIENEIIFEYFIGTVFKAEITNGNIISNNDGLIKFSFNEPGEASLKITANIANDGCDSVVTYNYTVDENPPHPVLLIDNNLIKSDIPAYFSRNGEPINNTPFLELNPEFNGKYEAFAINENGCRSDLSNAIFVSFVSVSAIDNGIKIYPNPASDLLNIETDGTASVSIIGLNGIPLYMADISGHTKIDLKDFSAGFYLVQIKINDTTFREKLIIK